MKTVMTIGSRSRNIKIRMTIPRPLKRRRNQLKTEEIVIDDKGGNEQTALAWMDAWFAMYKALPRDNMAYITQGVVDSLEISRVSKEGAA